MTLAVEVVSPERILFEGEADMVIARTVGGGDIAFLTGHAPFLGALETEVVTIRSSKGDERAAVHGGFISVAGDRVVILSDVAELAGQIDVERARRAEEGAQAAVRAGEDVEADAALRRARARLRATGTGTDSSH